MEKENTGAMIWMNKKGEIFCIDVVADSDSAADIVLQSLQGISSQGEKKQGRCKGCKCQILKKH